MCLVFTLVYSLSALCKVSSSFSMLLLGRVLGGLGTSLLWTSWESWYIHQHCVSLRLPRDWMTHTFTSITFYNGLLAILAGILSSFLAEDLSLGPLSPFLLAVPVLITSAAVLSSWEENYGDKEGAHTGSFMDGLRLILEDRALILLGGIQTCAESAMFIFVFLWTPVLDSEGEERMSLGWVFSCFMLSLMVGAQVSRLLSTAGKSQQKILRQCLIIMTVAMAVSALSTSRHLCHDPLHCQQISFAAFLLMEAGVGAYLPVISRVRSRVIPESCRASVMSWYRLPLNLVTCVTILANNIRFINIDKSILFAICSLSCSIGVTLINQMERYSMNLI